MNKIEEMSAELLKSLLSSGTTKEEVAVLAWVLAEQWYETGVDRGHIKATYKADPEHMYYCELCCTHTAHNVSSTRETGLVATCAVCGRKQNKEEGDHAR